MHQNLATFYSIISATSKNVLWHWSQRSGELPDDDCCRVDWDRGKEDDNKVNAQVICHVLMTEGLGLEEFYDKIQEHTCQDIDDDVQ